VRFIARGGMGEVYEAEDQVLHERVALKTIRPDVASDARAMERFHREVHLARTVTHPNVSRIYDLFHHGDLAFLTMELLSGETLSERLKREGRMGPADALPLVEQMAAALAAAHDAGVIHRDFKSGNVMLVPDERRPGGSRVVVTDFGLARRTKAPRGTSLTETETVLGTPDYMAPEQIEGRPLTPAADVYALGIVMYEMVTGGPPFQGDTPLSVALKKLREAPPSPRDSAPDLPTPWERAILRCLERDPADRYPTALDVPRAIRGETTEESPRATRGRRRRLWIALGAAAVIAAAALLLPRLRTPRPAPVETAASSSSAAAARAPRRAIAVLGFRNTAGRPADAWMSTALSEMLTTELAAGEKLRAVPSESVARMRVDLSLPEADTLAKDTLARVRQNVGADVVLLGSYLVLGPEAGAPVRVDLRLQDTTAGETIAVVSEKGAASELDALVGRAGARLREKLELPAISAGEAEAVRASLPANTDAARLYAEGLARLRVFDDMGAKELLEKAVAADPKHALAHSALAAAWSSLGYDAKALAEARLALQNSDKVSRETRLLIEGRYRAMHDEWDRAIEIYRSLFTFFPDDLEYALLLANAQTRAGRPNDALATLAAIRKASPRDDARVDLTEAETARALSDFPRAEKAAMRAAAIASGQGARLGVANALLLQASARRNLGDAKKAMEAAEEARRLFDAAGDQGGVASALNHIGNSQSDLGDLAAARKSYEGVLEVARRIGTRRAEAGALDNIASIVGDQGDLATARRLSEEALAIFREIGDRAGEATTLNNIGAALVSRGDLEGARTSFERAVPIYRETGDRGGLAIALNNIGEMQANQGDVAAASKSFTESLAIFRESNQRSKSVYPLAGLAGIRFESGDLAEARKMLDEAAEICRGSQDRHELAFVLSGLGHIALEEDRLADARASYEQALRIRGELGEKGAAEQSTVDLARLSFEEGDAAAAFAKARGAGDEFHKQNLPDDEAAAMALAARAAVKAGRKEDAASALEKARAAGSHSQHDGVRRELLLAGAAVQGARGQAEAARRTLQDAARRANAGGLVTFALEARLGALQIALAPGRRAGAEGPAKAEADALEKDARAGGFARIARLAAAER
jgi:tetratricopeptide (TPR) repeat protein/tRNA A-37 threonylcarbamoyl transferase component Bud32/TolB-like protein